MDSWTAATGDSGDGESNDWQRHIEHDLGGQAPQLCQAWQVPCDTKALDLSEVREPWCCSRRACLRDEEECPHEDEKPGWDEPGRSACGVGPDRSEGRAVSDAAGVGQVEKKAAQDEEEGNTDVHPGQKTRKDLPPCRTGDKTHVRQEDRDRGQGPDALQLQKVMAAGQRRRSDAGICRGNCHLGTATTTGASVTQRPPCPAVGVTLTAATRVCQGTWYART